MNRQHTTERVKMVAIGLKSDALGRTPRLLLWNSTLPLQPPPHAAVSDVDRFAEHQRAATNDAGNAARFARSNRFFRHAAVSKGPMEPHPRHTEVTALSHDLV
jgi:cell division septation protein DedD